MHSPNRISGYLVRVSNIYEERRVFEFSIGSRELIAPINDASFSPSAEILSFLGVDWMQYDEIDFQDGHRKIRGGQEPSLDLSGVVINIGEFDHEAKLFASQTGSESLNCSSWKELLRILETECKSYVTVIADIESLPYEFFGNLIGLENFMSGTGTQVGFLTGSSPTEVRWSVLKSLLINKQPETDDLFMFGMQDIGVPNVFEGIQTLWWENTTREQLNTLSESNYFLTALVSHSNGIDGNFGGVILCPVLNGDFAKKQYDGINLEDFQRVAAPSCTNSNLCQRDPNGTKYRFHPHSLRSEILLYDTCAGFLTSDAFSHPGASLGLSFVSGPCSAYITSIRKKTSSPYIAVLFRALLYDGYSLGRITQILNRFQATEYGEMPSFLLFGDPRFSLDLEHSKQVDEVFETDDTLRLDNWFSYSYMLSGLDADLKLIPGKGHDEIITFDLSTKLESQHWIVRSGIAEESVSLLQFDMDFHITKPISILITEIRRSLSFLEVLVNGLSKLGTVETGDWLRVVSTASELLIQLEQIRQASMQSTWHSNKYNDISSGFTGLTNAINILNKSIPVLWRQTKQWLVLHHYYGHLLEQIGCEKLAGDSCTICNSSVSIKRFGHVNLSIQREMYTCIRCGVVADLPVGMTVPRIDGPDECKSGTKVTQRIQFSANIPETTEISIVGYFGGFGAEVVVCEIEMEQDVCEATSKGEFTKELTLVFSEDCPAGLYSLVIVGSFLLMPFTIAKYISVNNGILKEAD